MRTWTWTQLDCNTFHMWIRRECKIILQTAGIATGKDQPSMHRRIAPDDLIFGTKTGTARGSVRFRLVGGVRPALSLSEVGMPPAFLATKGYTRLSSPTMQFRLRGSFSLSFPRTNGFKRTTKTSPKSERGVALTHHGGCSYSNSSSSSSSTHNSSTRSSSSLQHDTCIKQQYGAGAPE